MLFEFGASSLLALSLAALPCLGFLRSAPNISPDDYAFAQYGAVPNIDGIIAYNGSGIKSYWWANFLEGTNGHSYCVVITSANAGPNMTVSSMSVADITTGYHFGTAINEVGQLSNTKFEDISTLFPNFEFNLQWAPKGPNLYQGGLGYFEFGAALAITFDAVEALPSGTMVVNGTDVTIVPEKSATWIDYQWAPGYAVGGWHDFVVLLDNGVRMQITVTKPDPAYKVASFTTMMYPDGHQEVWPVDNNTYPANPWVSSLSNITYYIVKIPLKNTILYAHLPLESGETGPSKGANNANTICDTFAWFNGTFDGFPVRGYGIMELRENAACGSYGAC